MWKVCSKCLADYNDKQFGGCPNCEGKKRKIIEEEIEKLERQQIINEYFNQVDTEIAIQEDGLSLEDYAIIVEDVGEIFTLTEGLVKDYQLPEFINLYKHIEMIQANLYNRMEQMKKEV